MRGGTLWSLVDWTPRGTEQVINREYRFLSPYIRLRPEHHLHRVTGERGLAGSYCTGKKFISNKLCA
ncbi:phage protease [Pseudomonas chlororaphis]|uniref:phage protease n=1 Tax=Pseudomonas chlororaphis TaxID=587753 RepID=UPI0020A004D4|nr:phage protease [Pseudomonas chlororaphis]